jgi:hypothetical protein
MGYVEEQLDQVAHGGVAVRQGAASLSNRADRRSVKFYRSGPSSRLNSAPDLLTSGGSAANSINGALRSGFLNRAPQRQESLKAFHILPVDAVFRDATLRWNGSLGIGAKFAAIKSAGRTFPGRAPVDRLMTKRAAHWNASVIVKTTYCAAKCSTLKRCRSCAFQMPR